MKNFSLIVILFFTLKSFAFSKDNSFYPDDLFYIDHMDSHDKKFALYFKEGKNLFWLGANKVTILMIIRKTFLSIIIQLNLPLR